MKNDFLWVEKYRPSTIDECVLPKELKTTFKEYVNKGEIPNILLHGGPGTGKTTALLALCNEVKCDNIFINGSSENGIDVFRTKITNYASCISLQGGRKAIIIDEAEYMNCLEENEEIIIGNIGNKKEVKLKELQQGVQYDCVSYNIETHEVENDILEVVSDSYNTVYEVEFEDGTVVLMTDDHPLILNQNYNNEKPLKDILTNFNEVDVVNVFV